MGGIDWQALDQHTQRLVHFQIIIFFLSMSILSSFWTKRPASFNLVAFCSSQVWIRGRWGHQKQTDSLIAFPDQSETYLYLSWKSIKGPQPVGGPAALTFRFFFFLLVGRCQASDKEMRLGTSCPCRLPICSCRSLFLVIFSLPLLGNDDCCAADDEINTARVASPSPSGRNAMPQPKKNKEKKKKTGTAAPAAPYCSANGPATPGQRPFAM